MTNFIFRTSFFVFFLVIGFVLLVSSVYTRESASSVVRDANTSDRAITKIDAIDAPSNSVRDTEVIFSGSPRAIQASLTHKSYTQFMRSFHTARIEGDVSQKNIMHDSFDAFINSEQEKLSGLSVDRNKVSAYVDRLRAMKTTFEVSTTETTDGSWWSRAWNTIQHFFSSDKSLEFESAHPTQIALPEKPARFLFDDTIVSVKNLTNLSVSSHDASRLNPKLLSLVQVEPVVASSVSFPLVEDIQASPEAPLSDRMIEQARSLHNNPLEIVNFVRNTISYEPYDGLKKGSEGCLAELSCNDADTAALTIDLLRSAGIPARFKSSVAVFSMESLTQLLGVDTPNLVYGALAKNNVPVYIVSGNEYPEQLMDSDLSAETEFGLEWIYVEMFYEYDERGAHIENTLDLSQVSSTEELQTVLQQYPKKQWVSIDVVVRPTVHTKKSILADQVSFDAEDFFYAYLQYQGELSPIEKYVQDVETASGVNFEDSLSTKNLVFQNLPIIPITLPFVVAEGMDEEGNTIVATPYSSLPESLYHTVTISLKKSDTSEVVLSHTYLPWEIHNAEIDLSYRGYSETDQSVIDAYGGIHATPAELVSLKAVFTGSFSETLSQNPISIGDTLILEFSLTHNGQELYTDQKFSTAGNAEGIYISLSHVLDNPLLPTDADRASSILLEGNAAIAREYLVHIAQEGKLLKQSLDYDYQTVFTRAVVTQNRILQKVNGVPTTFDFKGLTIDATTYINDYSNRGIITDHQKDFRVLWGLMASHYEGQVFTDLAGLSGISTVQGLQYAYAHPQEYSVHVITASNESEIDTLSLSSNTKANMHTDVANGNTIITPDKPVGEENWNGVLYVSLDPEWTGTYAIGEQVSGNGGWTIDDLLIASAYESDSGLWFDYWYKLLIDQDSYYGYQDMPSNADSVSCSLTKTTFDQIKADSGWKEAYGFPCKKGSVYFGSIEHVYILATNGAKFYRANQYNYWISRSQIFSKINGYIQNKKQISSDDPTWIKDGILYSSKFSTILGTYIQSSCDKKSNVPGISCPDQYQSTIYYSPDNSQNGIFRATGDILYKLGNNNTVVKLIGFPTSDIAYAATSNMITNWENGKYQNFVNGQMYTYTHYAINSTQYTYGKIKDLHNQQGGTGGSLGFPLNDPQTGSNGVVFQTFENNSEIELSNSGIAKVIPFKNYRCELYGDVKNQFLLNFILVKGFADGSVALVGDLGSLAWNIWKGIYNYDETFNAISTALDQFDLQKSIAFIGDAGSVGYQYLKEEYNSSFGSQGCPARQAYIEGRITPDILTIAIPASKLSQISKLKLVNKVGDLKYITKVKNFGENTVNTFQDITKFGKYKGEPAFWVLDDFVEKGETKWYTDPLNSQSKFKLQQAITDGYLKGDLKYGFYSIEKAVGDPYLLNLSNKGDEIIFVLKSDGSIVIAPRGSYNPFPHPLLSDGEKVVSAGTIKFYSNALLEINNASGHFWPSFDSLTLVKSRIKQTFPNVEVIMKNFE